MPWSPKYSKNDCNYQLGVRLKKLTFSSVHNPSLDLIRYLGHLGNSCQLLPHNVFYTLFKVTLWGVNTHSGALDIQQIAWKCCFRHEWSIFTSTLYSGLFTVRRFSQGELWHAFHFSWLFLSKDGSLCSFPSVISLLILFLNHISIPPYLLFATWDTMFWKGKPATKFSDKREMG